MMKRIPARSFQDLIVWQKGHQFVLSIYRLTDSFPKNEIYGLTSQLRRAAISIPANIAEGFKKKTKGDKTRFMKIAQGSVEECRYYLESVYKLWFSLKIVIPAKAGIQSFQDLLDAGSSPA